ERAAALAQALGPRARACTPDELDAADRFDLVVNATAAGHAGAAFALPGVRIAPTTFCYDLSYGPAARPFLDRSRAAGARVAVDGLGMLVEQAAESFELWHGVRPDTGPVYAMLRD